MLFDKHSDHDETSYYLREQIERDRFWANILILGGIGVSLALIVLALVIR